LDWVDYGLECVKRYKEFRRQPCFSHDELLVTAAQNLKTCYKSDIAWLKRGISDMQQRELADRKSVRTRKLKEVALSEDDTREELQCDYCHCYTYLSFIGCTCSDRVSCLDHSSEVKIPIFICFLH
jgi:histone demethylase JARID1